MRLIQQSLSQNSNNVVLLSIYGLSLGLLEIDGAVEVIDRAFRPNSFDVTTIVINAGRFLNEGRDPDAVRLIEMNLIADSKSYLANYITCVSSLVRGRIDTAEKYFHQARRVANPVERGLDSMESTIASLRGEAPRLTGDDSTTTS